MPIAANWATGHWLNGRLGGGTLRDIVAAILSDHGVTDADLTALSGDLDGIVQDGPPRRAASGALMALHGIVAAESGGRLTLSVPARLAVPARTVSVLAEPERAGGSRRRSAMPPTLRAARVLDLYDANRDYERRTLRSRRLGPPGERTLSLALPGTLHETAAEAAMEAALADHQLARRRLSFSRRHRRSRWSRATGCGFRATVKAVTGPLGTGHGRLGPSGEWLVERIEDGAMRRIEARGLCGRRHDLRVGGRDGDLRRRAGRPPMAISRPCS